MKYNNCMAQRSMRRRHAVGKIKAEIWESNQSNAPFLPIVNAEIEVYNQLNGPFYCNNKYKNKYKNKCTAALRFNR